MKTNKIVGGLMFVISMSFVIITVSFYIYQLLHPDHLFLYPIGLQMFWFKLIIALIISYVSSLVFDSKEKKRLALLYLILFVLIVLFII